MREPDEMVGLDELFGAGRAGGGEPRPARGPARPFDTRWWVRRLFVAVALTTVAWGVLWVARIGVSYPLLLLAIVSISIIREALHQVRHDDLPVAVTGRGLEPARQPTVASGSARAVRDSGAADDGIRVAVGRWEDRLAWGERDVSRFTALMVLRLEELVDARLHQHHGITIAGAPKEARALMGEELWTLLRQPLTRVPEPRAVASIVAKVEEL